MTRVDARQLWLVQLRLECKALDETGERIIRIAGPDPDEIPTCSVARFTDGFTVTFDSSVDQGVVEKAATVAPELFFEDSASVAEHLGGQRKLKVSKCSTYAFPELVAPPGPTIVRKEHERFGIFADGCELSGASSARTNSEAAELWVWTEPDARRRGYAEQVSRAWAAEVTGEGRVAFYSHEEDNDPSRRLAATLGVVHLFDLVQLTF
ncbi:MAG: GNAT family N-acetyltransferase [Nocardioidaceae bacterium]